MSGKSYQSPKESDVVVGFFMDASRQIPIIWGVVPGIETNPPNIGVGFHDLRSQATIAAAPKRPISRTYNTDGSGIVLGEANTANAAVLETLRHPNADELNQPSLSGVGRYQNLANTVIQARKTNLDKNIISARGVQWDEPYPAYNPEYPYDNVTETESGHVFELDDSPGAERVHIAHRTGSYIEWFPTGTKVEKVTKANYRIIMADDYLHVMGRVVIRVEQDALIKVQGDVALEVGGSMGANVAGDVDFSVGGGFNVKAANINLDATGGDITLVSASQHLSASQSQDLASAGTNIGSSGALNLQAGGSFNAQGSAVNILSGGTAAMQGSAINLNGTVTATMLFGNTAASGAGSAASPAQGMATGLPPAIAAGTKTTGETHPESVPVPSSITRVGLDAYTAQAYKQNQLLVQGPNNQLTQPDANGAAIPVNPCTFDPTTKVFIPKGNWTFSDAGVAALQTREGFAKVVKPDTVTSYFDPPGQTSVYAIGYGSTAAGIDQPVTMGELISRATAAEFLQYNVTKKALPYINSGVNVALTQNMIDALCSFIYNVGAGSFLRSTLRARINERNWCAAGDAFLVWCKIGQTTSAGLLKRRTQERNQFLS
jgi:GH24 family phage-related lysozyme (muramidase)